MKTLADIAYDIGQFATEMGLNPNRVYVTTDLLPVVRAASSYREASDEDRRYTDHMGWLDSPTGVIEVYASTFYAVSLTLGSWTGERDHMGSWTSYIGSAPLITSGFRGRAAGAA